MRKVEKHSLRGLGAPGAETVRGSSNWSLAESESGVMLGAGAPGTRCPWLGQRVSGLPGLPAKGMAVIRGAIIRNCAVLPYVGGLY